MTPPTHRFLTAAFAIALGAAMPSGAQVTGDSTAPDYSTQSIVHGATQTLVALAPNTIATLYGTNLAFSTHAAGPVDVVAGKLPTALDGVSVFVYGTPCSLLLVSPNQINFLVPYGLTAGTVPVVVSRLGFTGPTVNVQLNTVSPGLFVWNGNYAVAVHLSGQVVTAAKPAAAGEIVLLYAAGLGKTAPDTTNGQLAVSASPIVLASQLQVLLNGVPAPVGSVLYAGLAPGYAGLYQINLKLPAKLATNPVIQLALGGQISPAGVQLYTQ